MTTTCAPASIALTESEGESISVLGVEITFKSPKEAEEGWTVLDYKLPARQFGAPLHYHEKLIESFYILSGEVWFRLGDEEVTLGPGGFALVQPGTLHSFANRSDAPARMLCHASSPRHKEFLCKLFQMIEAASVWPPADHRSIVELGRQYDSVYS